MEDQNKIEPELTDLEKIAKENNLIEVNETAKQFEDILQVKSENVEQIANPIVVKKETTPLPKYQSVPLTALQGFATVLTILGVILAVYTLFVSVSFIMLLGYYLILILGIILSFFTLLLNEGYMAMFEAGNNVSNFLSTLSPSLPYTYGISFGMFLLSMILFGVSKKGKRRTSGMVINGVMMGIEIVIGVIILIGLQGLVI